MPSLNEGMLLSVAVPRIPKGQQADRTARALRVRETARECTWRLHDSQSAIQEYKRSLITAAVTGELDVATAGRGVPV